MDFRDLAFRDFVYKQEQDDSYALDGNGGLQLHNRNEVVDKILEVLKDIYTGIV